nr:Xaa-Pro aminopeptidase [Actinomycetota bacterium]
MSVANLSPATEGTVSHQTSATEGTTSHHPLTTEGTTSHDIPLPAGLAAAMAANWEPAPLIPHPASRSGALSPGAATCARNRAALSNAFPGQLVVVPAGVLKVRSNDTDYGFRAWSGFSWLTGETVEGAVLVLAPSGGQHTATLYIREYVGPGEPGYFTDRHYGALWVGNVPGLGQSADVLGLDVRPLTDLGTDLARHRGERTIAPRGLDPELDRLLPGAEAGTLEQVLDELRLTKDDWEIGQLQAACDATARGFADVAAELPNVLAGGGRRGERWLEGTFWRRARMDGNEVGYSSIVGAGSHATTLHWWRNDGDLEPGQLLLADMGVETDELYTADVTRTMPVTGEWTVPQR